VDAATSDAFDASAPWRLSEQVSLREESFGALAYHHGNRRLVFLKSRTLVDLVRALGEHDSAAQAVAHFVAPVEQASYERALASLARAEVLRGR
jgi:putative mycofactocin binding protein MftB